MQQYQLVPAVCCHFEIVFLPMFSYTEVFFSLQCNGRLSQQLLSKKGGREEVQ